MAKIRSTEKIKTTPCVGCGYCCIKTPCDASRRLYPGASHCPQLLWLDDRYECGLMKIAGLVGEGYRQELHAGEGCCCSLNDWRKNVKRREPQLNRTLINPLPEVMQVFIKCLAAEFMSGDKMFMTLHKMGVLLKESGYDEDEIENIKTCSMHVFSENQNSFMKEFMG